MSRDPRVTVAIIDAADPYSYGEVRGEVVETVTGPEARAHIDQLAQKYHGHRLREPDPVRAGDPEGGAPPASSPAEVADGHGSGQRPTARTSGRAPMWLITSDAASDAEPAALGQRAAGGVAVRKPAA